MITLLWLGFFLFIAAMLAIDLGVLNRNNPEPSAGKALRWTAICAGCALVFNVAVYFLYDANFAGLGLDPRYPLSGQDAALQFLSGWLLDQTLSLDNVFVIAVIFSYFKVPMRYQHRVLLWGIVGALVMRGIVIAGGSLLLESVSWAHYVFGAMLIFAAVKILFVDESGFDPQKNLIYRIARRVYPISANLDGERFFTIENGKKAATPLFLVLLLIETTDVFFALDSIPAVFAITRDPFLVFTSNVFAILSLRSLYFALALLVGRFHLLKYGLLLVLLFVGGKMMLHDFVHIDTVPSFLAILTLILGAIVASLVFPKKEEASVG